MVLNNMPLLNTFPNLIKILCDYPSKHNFLQMFYFSLFISSCMTLI